MALISTSRFMSPHHRDVARDRAHRRSPLPFDCAQAGIRVRSTPPLAGARRKPPGSPRGELLEGELGYIEVTIAQSDAQTGLEAPVIVGPSCRD